MDQLDAQRSERTAYLRKWIFKGTCPVCLKRLNGRHAVAHVGSCNFNGPSLWNGFLEQVKNRTWAEVVLPFSRLTSQDMMACELLRCPDALAIVVWVEVDLAIAGDQYLVYFERIDAYDLSNIEKVASISWSTF